MKKINLLALILLCCLAVLAPQAFGKGDASDSANQNASKDGASADGASGKDGASADGASGKDGASADNSTQKQDDRLVDPTAAVFPPAPRYVLQGIAKNNSVSFCAINGLIFEKNDPIDEFVIVEIAHDYVSLKDNSQNSLKLKMY
jgi:hypothetical protein